ncbi:BICD family-like cargo adapter 1 isoform X2 [Balaenoptera musculus]|uniref:BICD family-like cargo adapter 1 isoform X2 n=1 Tax=Balaenoptera musculus TaxID=9771 RepID=A0A8B8VEU8_BALMU|nr:BICD family-like cargo adapter 1 isoform X2 [Balaenoptera musculus]
MMQSPAHETGGQVRNVSDPSPPGISIRAKARAEGPSGTPHPGKPQTTTPSSVTLPQSPESQVAGALGDTQTEPSLDQVLRERDEAIAKKRAVEAELDIFKAKLRAVEAQLLEVLEEKLRLRQEVEAWEDDMQRLVRQQVESQLQRESRGALGAPMDPGTARTSWVRFTLSRWGRWR